MPHEGVWTSSEDRSAQGMVLSRGRTDLIYILKGSLAPMGRMVQR